MARYRISHDLDRTWIGKKPDGTYHWVDYKNAFLFPNYKAAKEALYSMPDERRMYGESFRTKVHYMKFYDSDEHFKQEQAYLENKRVLRSWGY